MLGGAAFACRKLAFWRFARYHVPVMRPDKPRSAIKSLKTRVGRALESTPRSVHPILHGSLNKILPERYDPRILAKGGEHLVFRFNEPYEGPPTDAAGKKRRAKERKRQIVYKVNFHETKPILKAVASGNEEKVKQALGKMREKIEAKRDSIGELRLYFGFDSVPAQQFMVRDVPITPEIVASLDESLVQASAKVTSIPAWVEVQRELELESAVSLTGFYPESPHSPLREEHKEDYAEIYDAGHDVLTGGPMSDMSPETQVSYVLNMYPELQEVSDKARKDRSFKRSLHELSDKLIDFIEETGIALDLAGRNNMVMVKHGESWSVKFPDVLAPSDFSFINLKIALEDVHRGHGIGERSRLVAANLVNTVRIVNALALISGNDRRLRYPALAGIMPEDWRKEMKPVFARDEQQ